MSFPRMRESPSSANQGIPAFAGMTRKGSFHTVSFAGMTEIEVFTQSRMRESHKVCLVRDSCIRINDNNS
ncbi:MAG: hypothetical protein NT007_19400 [Candidatus Kapabacteria bacterium]|nr:hypothetical protein [Candidatus Kapabacteria bacterium]